MVPVALLIYGYFLSPDYLLQSVILRSVAKKKNWHIVKLLSYAEPDTKYGMIEAHIDYLTLLASAGEIKKVLVYDMKYFGNASNRQIVLENLDIFGVPIYIHEHRRETSLTKGERVPSLDSYFLLTRLFANRKKFATRIDKDVPSRIDRIRAGQAKAKSQNKHIARPKGSFKSTEQIIEDYPEVIKYLQKGTYSIRDIEKLTNISRSTIMKVKKVISSDI